MKHPKKPKPKPKRGAAGLTMSPADGALWLTGGNDEYPSCVATAIGNSLLAVTGIRVTDEDVLALHQWAGSGDGVSIADTLAKLAKHGIGGHRPAWYAPHEPGTGGRNGLIVGMTDGVDDHAVTLTRQGLISWGAPLSDKLAFGWQQDGEAWYINWEAV